MWPSYVNNGAELTYGINSNAYLTSDISSAGRSFVLTEDDENTKSGHQRSLKYALENLEFPRGLQLFEVAGSAVVLNKPVTPTLPSSSDIPFSLMCDDFNIDLSSALSYSKYYHDFNKESSLWQSRYIYDPSVSNLLICETFSHNLRILVYTDGLQNGVLKFSLIKIGKKMISLIPNKAKFLEQNGLVRVKDLEINLLSCIDVRVPVLGLTFSKDIYIKNSVTVRYLAVRTNSLILVYKVSCALFKAFNVKLLDTIAGVFYDVSFNYWNKSRFATISANNIWRIWEIKNEKITIPKNSEDEILTGKLSLNNFSDLSRWKKIIWGNTLDDLIIFTRSSVFFLKLYGMRKPASHIIKRVNVCHNSYFSENKEQVEGYEEHLKLRNCHIEIVDLHLDELFILTSQEIIWAKIDTDSSNNVNKLKKIVSWKHFLNSDDPSLRFSLNTVSSSKFEYGNDEKDREYIALIFSNIHPNYISVRFRYQAEDGLYYIVGGAPSILNISRNSKLYDQFSTTQRSILLDLNPADNKRKRNRNSESAEDSKHQIDESINNLEDYASKSISKKQKFISDLTNRPKKSYKSNEFVTETDEEEEELANLSDNNVNIFNRIPNISQTKKVMYNYNLFDHQYFTLLNISTSGILIKHLISNEAGTKTRNDINSSFAISGNKLVGDIIKDEIDALEFATRIENENFRIRDVLLNKVLINNSENMNNKVNELYLKIFENKKISKLTPEVHSTLISELDKDVDISEEAFLIVSDWNIEGTDSEYNGAGFNRQGNEDQLAGISNNFVSNEDNIDPMLLRETGSYEPSSISAKAEMTLFSQADSISSQKSLHLSSQFNSQNGTSSLTHKKKRKKKRLGFA